MKEYKVGIIGLGQRGLNMTKQIVDIKGVKVTAVCDLYKDRIERICEIIKEKTGNVPSLCTDNYKDIIVSDISILRYRGNSKPCAKTKFSYNDTPAQSRLGPRVQPGRMPGR